MVYAYLTVYALVVLLTNLAITIDSIIGYFESVTIPVCCAMQDTNGDSGRGLVSEKARLSRRTRISSDRPRSAQGRHAGRNAGTIR